MLRDAGCFRLHGGVAPRFPDEKGAALMSQSPQGSHSGLLEPRGTSTVRKAPGVRDKTTWSVMP
jgi:hypothetical protein